MVYLQKHLAHLNGVNVGKYSSTMVRIWAFMIGSERRSFRTMQVSVHAGHPGGKVHGIC